MIDLSSMNARVHRGDDHLKALDAEIRRFQDPDSYTILRERNGECTDYSVGIRFHVRPDLHHWATIAGDALTNYRGALDQFIYAMAIHFSQKTPPPFDNELAFPICDTPGRFDAAVKRNRLGEMRNNPLLVAAVKKTQPFDGPDRADLRILRRLRDLDDAHKHREVQLAVFALQEIGANMRGLAAGEAVLTVNEGPLDRESPLMRLQLPAPSPNVEMKLNVSIRIAFANDPKPADAMLQIISNCRQAVFRVRDVVVTELAISADVFPAL